MKISALALTLAAAFAVNVHADTTAVNGPMSFNPIDASAYGMDADSGIAATPWVIPEGYVQSIVSDESGLDIYVANDTTPNPLFLNQGSDRFVDDALLLGAAVSRDGSAGSSMAHSSMVRACG